MIEMGVDNGILAKIRGDDISAGACCCRQQALASRPSCPRSWTLPISARCGSPTD